MDVLGRSVGRGGSLPKLLRLLFTTMTVGLCACPADGQPTGSSINALPLQKQSLEQGIAPGGTKEWNSPTAPKLPGGTQEWNSPTAPKLPGGTQEWNSPTAPKAPGGTQEWNSPTAPKLPGGTQEWNSPTAPKKTP